MSRIPHSLPTHPRWLIVGCGYVGQQLAHVGLRADHSVYALTRDPSRVAELKSWGVQPRIGHWLDPSSLHDLPPVDIVLISVPHRPGAGSEASAVADLQTHAVGLNNLLKALPSGWRKLIYLSTTGVYGQDSEAWLDEDSPAVPTRSGPQLALLAEQWLHAHVPAEKFTVLRLAGIYGPGRIPLAEQLRSGAPLAVPRQGFLNLVHVADIAQMLFEVAHANLQRSLYVFSDGQPVLRETFYSYLAGLCGCDAPQFVEPDAASPKARRATDKRVRPDRLVAETAFNYRFPSYLSGLRNALGLD